MAPIGKRVAIHLPDGTYPDYILSILANSVYRLRVMWILYSCCRFFCVRKRIGSYRLVLHDNLYTEALLEHGAHVSPCVNGCITGCGDWTSAWVASTLGHYSSPEGRPSWLKSCRLQVYLYSHIPSEVLFERQIRTSLLS